MGLLRERHMHRHLVTVEVGIEGRADQGMELNGASFNQHRFKSLNTQAMQRRSTVQQNRVILDDLFEHIPHLWLYPLYKAFRALDIVRDVLLYQPAHHERLYQFPTPPPAQSPLLPLQSRPPSIY